MEPISMTENLKIWVPAHPLNPSGFGVQKGRRETNVRAALAGVDEIQVFAVTLRRRHHDVKNGVTACSTSKADPRRSSFVPLCVPEGQFVSSGQFGKARSTWTLALAAEVCAEHGITAE